MNRAEKIFNNDWKLFKNYDIEGTFDNLGCDLFILKGDFELHIVFENDILSLFINDDLVIEFDYCENFEEEVYKNVMNYLIHILP